MRIRRFRDTDAVAVARLRRDTIRTINAKDYPPKHIRAWTDGITVNRIRTSPHKKSTFVAVHHKKIIGVGQYTPQELRLLYIHKDHLGKGIGKAILGVLERDALQHGIRTFTCFSTITARPFYEKMGFKTIKRSTLPLKGQRLIIYQMKKRLKAPR